jgi:acetyl esterase/lipase
MKTYVETLPPNGASLTCYLHDKSKDLGNADVRPAMLVFPGGGYSFCSDREAEPIALAYMAEGYNAFVLRYSVKCDNAFGKALDDAEAALAYLRNNADELNIDAAKIAVVGFSAGGHLASALGTLSGDKPNALILAYAVTSAFGPPEYNVPDTYDKVSEATPPAFLFATSDDNVVPGPNSLKFALALDEYDIYYEIHVYMTGQHGLSLAKPLTANSLPAMVEPDAAEWFSASVRFLRNVFGDFQIGGEKRLSVLQSKLRPGIGTAVKRLLKNPVAADVLERLMPGFTANVRENKFAMGMSLSALMRWSPDKFPDGMAERLAEELEKLNQ